MPTQKIPFKTAYGERERHFIPSGSIYADEYGYEIDDLGRKQLVKTGETNVYLRIQEQLEMTKIENIIARAQMGDMSDFNENAVYVDTTELPNNLIDARKQIQKLENLWNSLSVEQKAKYNNDLGEFIGDAGKDSWMEVMGYTTKEKPLSSETTVEKQAEGVEVNE